MKLLIVDDHAVVREGLSAMVHRAEPSAVVLQAATFAEGLALAESHRDLDAVVLDLKMPDSDGIAAIRDLGTRRPDVPVIVLSSCEDPVEVRRASMQGAGLCSKSASSQTFRRRWIWFCPARNISRLYCSITTHFSLMARGTPRSNRESRSLRRAGGCVEVACERTCEQGDWGRSHPFG